MATIEQQLIQAALDLYKEWAKALESPATVTMHKFQEQKINLISIALIYGQSITKQEQVNALTTPEITNKNNEVIIA